MHKTMILLTVTTTLTGATIAMAAAREPGIPQSEKTFQRLDKNKDSRLDLSELTPQSERRFMRLDTNKDGTVTSAEIDAWLQAIAEKRKQRILKRMDANNDGAISKAEVDAYIGGLFTAADANADGGVTIAEAQAYHAAKRKEYYDALKAKRQQN